jgi:hypothetical protein
MAAWLSVVTTVMTSSRGTSGSATTSATASGIAVTAIRSSVCNALAVPAEASTQNTISNGSFIFIGHSPVLITLQ